MAGFRPLRVSTGVPSTLLCLCAVLALAGAAGALDVQGTVRLQGTIRFATPVLGITFADVFVEPLAATEATGNGVKCSVLSVDGDFVGTDGAYPDSGSVGVEILMERGGPQLPEGACLIRLQAAAWDGSATTVRGSQAALIDAATVQVGGTVQLGELVARASPAVAGVESDCLKWVKKQTKLRAKCNFLVLRKGPEVAALRCKHAEPHPPSCDPGLHVPEILAMSHGMNDQQLDPAAGQTVDLALLGDAVKCQQRLGKAAQKYAAKRLTLVQKKCIKPGLDTVGCREEQSQVAKRKLDGIDRCVETALVDGGTGRLVPDLGTPCDQCVGAAGTIDRKCLKACFATSLDALTDGIAGDTPQCGDGILQGGEFCDDGNVASGDGCSSLCGLEP